MPASYTIRRCVPRNTTRSKPASTPSTCFPSFSINLFMAFPLPRGDLSSNTTNIIREQETPSPFGCGYAALWIQYNELGGTQDSEVPGVTGGSKAYIRALNNLDSDMSQYIHDNTEDELTHHTFINAYLASKGAATVNCYASSSL